ncbi:hypothetical protein AAKU55_003754 [Oxalobacteraceae bacterium GrIS 1.11]
MKALIQRNWLVNWLYLTVAAHLLAGLLLPWIAGAPLFDAYHRTIEAAFWSGAAPAAARAQQLWWMSLFGATVQAAAIWMAALLRIGDQHRSCLAWGALIAGLLWWAPQDMLISIRAACWAHVWIDALALTAMLPPLCYLWLADRRSAP